MTSIDLLPLPTTDGFVNVTILDGGGMIGRRSLIHADDDNSDIHMSCWVFYIDHPRTGKKTLWDIGISSVNPIKPRLT
jgi:hypothetical protein